MAAQPLPSKLSTAVVLQQVCMKLQAPGSKASGRTQAGSQGLEYTESDGMSGSIV